MAGSHSWVRRCRNTGRLAASWASEMRGYSFQWTPPPERYAARSAGQASTTLSVAWATGIIVARPSGSSTTSA